MTYSYAWHENIREHSPWQHPNNTHMQIRGVGLHGVAYSYVGHGWFYILQKYVWRKYVWNGSLVYVTPCSHTPLIYLCYRSVSFGFSDRELIFVTWPIRVCDMTNSHVWYDSFICVTWLIHMCAVIHAYVWHDSFICATWLIHMCAVTHAYAWHDLFICATWLIRMRDMRR